MVKGGMLKDDADLAKLAFKPRQQIMVIGTAGPLPERPKTETVFLEDMDDGELALAVRSRRQLLGLLVASAAKRAAVADLSALRHTSLGADADAGRPRQPR